MGKILIDWFLGSMSIILVEDTLRKKHDRLLHKCQICQYLPISRLYYTYDAIVIFQWITFFSDLLSCISSGNLAAVDLYLRILLAIDVEVVDRDIVHTPEVSKNSLNSPFVNTLIIHNIIVLVYRICHE